MATTKKTTKKSTSKKNKLVQTPKLEKYEYIGTNAGNKILFKGVTIKFPTITDGVLDALIKNDPSWLKYFQLVKEEI